MAKPRPAPVPPAEPEPSPAPVVPPAPTPEPAGYLVARDATGRVVLVPVPRESPR